MNLLTQMARPSFQVDHISISVEVQPNTWDFFKTTKSPPSHPFPFRPECQSGSQTVNLNQLRCRDFQARAAVSMPELWASIWRNQRIQPLVEWGVVSIVLWI